MSHFKSGLAHKVEGEGIPLLLLNGIGMTIPAWQPVIKQLKGKYRIIRCDFRGQMQSPGAVHNDIKEHAHDIKYLLDSLNLGSVHLMGTSFGGLVAVLLGALYPEKVASMTIVASADKFDQGMDDEVTRWIRGAEYALESGDKPSFADILNPVVYSETFREENREMLEGRKQLFKKFPDRWFSDLILLMKSAQGRDLTDYLIEIVCPTQVVAAEYDRFIPVERCRAMAEGIHGAVFSVLKQAGHAAVIEKPEDMAALVDTFIN